MSSLPIVWVTGGAFRRDVVWVHVLVEVVIIEADAALAARVVGVGRRAPGGRGGGFGGWVGAAGGRAPGLEWLGRRERGGGFGRGGAGREAGASSVEAAGRGAGGDGAVIGAGGAAGAIVESLTAGGARRGRIGIAIRVAVEVVELVDEVAGFGELCEIDLTAADQVEDELAQVGERVVAAAVGADVVEPGAALAGTPFEGIADDAGGGAQQGSQGSSQLGRTEAAASLACNGGSVTSGLRSAPP